MAVSIIPQLHNQKDARFTEVEKHSFVVVKYSKGGKAMTNVGVVKVGKRH